MIASRLREQRALGVDVLDDRFDDVVGVGQRVERRRRRQPAERGVAIGGGQLALLDELREALLDRRARAIEHRLRDVDEPHVETRLREHLRDAVAHRARADDADGLDVHRDSRVARHESRSSAIARAASASCIRPFDRERDAVAAAQAQRRDAALQVAPLQRVEQRRQHARAARADRVAERDGAAVAR